MKRLLKFYIDGCGPCREQARILDGLGNVSVESIDCDADGELAERYGIHSVPTLVLLDEHDHEVQRFTGLTQLSDIVKML